MSARTPYAFFSAEIKPPFPVKLMLLSPFEFEKLRGGEDVSPGLTWVGERIRVSVRLSSGDYVPAILSLSEGTTVRYVLHAFEPSVPVFEREGAYAPVGVADYGVVELPDGRVGYRYEYTEAWGHALIERIYAVRAFDDSEARHWVTLQLNAVLNVETAGGTQRYWVQGVVSIDTHRMRARCSNNVWNLTSYPASVLSKGVVRGRGAVKTERILGRVNYYYFYTNPGSTSATP